MKESCWKKWHNDSYENLDNFPLYGFCICMDSVFMGRSTPTTAFDGAILIFCPYNVDTLSLRMKEFGLEKIFFD